MDHRSLRSIPVSEAQASSTTHSSKGQRAFIGAAIILFALLSAYLALVIITRVDHLFLPGNELTLDIPVASQVLEAGGVDTEGTSGGKERINILVMGLDRRAREGDAPSRTDTIFILTIDPKTKSAGIMGIPRDLVVDIPLESGGSREDRINAVYVEGELNDYPGGGIQLMKDTIERNFVTTNGQGEEFRLKIDKYVIVDFEGFEQIIDALGGIDVDVPEYVYDPYYSETELPGDYLPQEFEEGQHHMDGQTALAYSRIRFSSDDLDRIQRQQRVIFATIDKAKGINVLGNAVELWDKYKDAIKTDINDGQITGYALLAKQVQDELYTVSIGGATVPYTTPQGAAVLIGDWDAIGEIVGSLFVDEPGTAVHAEATSVVPVRVEIQNGTEVDGLASRVASYIVRQGYPVDDVLPGNALDGTAHETTLILDLGGNNEKNRLQLAGWLNIDPTNVRAATIAEKEAYAGTTAEIVVVIGADFNEETLTQTSQTSTPGG